MIFLPNSTDKVRVITSSAAAIAVSAHYGQNASGTLTFDRTNTAISSATTTDVLTGTASATRKLKFMSIRNKDASLTCTVTVLYEVSGPTDTEMIQQLLNPGDTLEYMEGAGFYLLTANANQDLFKILTADDAGGQAVNTVQPWFPTTGTLTVPAASTYRMEGLLQLTHGATSHSTGISFGGTATLTSLEYYAQAHRSAANTIISVFSGIMISGASNATVDAAGTQAATYVMINGIIRINAAGTLIPQFTFSANPTGTITVKRNSFFRLKYLGDNTVAAAGSWA